MCTGQTNGSTGEGFRAAYDSADFVEGTIAVGHGGRTDWGTD